MRLIQFSEFNFMFTHTSLFNCMNQDFFWFHDFICMQSQQPFYYTITNTYYEYKKVYSIAQSICTHHFCFENQGLFVTLKKNRAPCFLKKTGCKNQGHYYSKREEAAWSLLFLNNNDPVFLDPAFCKKQGPQFFKSSRP